MPKNPWQGHCPLLPAGGGNRSYIPPSTVSVPVIPTPASAVLHAYVLSGCPGTVFFLIPAWPSSTSCLVAATAYPKNTGHLCYAVLFFVLFHKYVRRYRGHDKEGRCFFSISLVSRRFSFSLLSWNSSCPWRSPFGTT